MDLHHAPNTCHSNIWPSNSCGRPNWFSKRTNFQYRKSESNVRLGKPPSLLRLSSTGDSVVEDTAEFKTFDPSNFQRSGSDSLDVRGPPRPPTCAKSSTTGIFDRFTKFALSASSYNTSRDLRQTAAMSLTRESGRLPDQNNQVELDFLMKKCNCQEVEMDRPGQQYHYQQDNNMMHVTHPQQGGVMMNGYVKEGIYHPFARNVESQPLVQAFHFLNFGPFSHPNHYHRHPHPYMRRNQFMPNRKTSLQIQFGSLTDPGSTSDTPRSHVMDHTRYANNQIRTSAVLQNKMAEPRIRPHFTTVASDSCDAQIQAHVSNHNQQKNVQCYHHRDHFGKNPMMKNQTNMTHQNKSPTKATGSNHLGCSHQTQRPSPCTNNTMSKQNNGLYGQKSVKQSRLEFSLKAELKKQDFEHGIESCKQHQDMKESEKKSDSLDSVTTDVKPEEIDQNRQIFDIGQNENLLENQVLQQQSNIASSVGIGQLEIDCYVKAEPQSLRAKSEDNKTTSGNSVTLVTTQQPVSNLPCSSVRQVLQKHVEDVSASSNTDVGCPQIPTQSVSNPSSSIGSETPSSKTESESADSLNSKPLHSSLAFLLSEPSNNDSDFSDSDWDSTGTSPSSDSWDFLKCWDDPYNPLYGWKCANRTDQQQGTEKDVDLGKPDSSFGDDEIDSGISSLQAQQDETEEAFAEESDSWDEEESNKEQSSGELCQLWKSFCPSNDPFNPLNGWMCNSSETKTENTATACQTPNITEVQLKTELEDEPMAMQSKTRPGCQAFQPRGSETTPVMLHPSVLFILGFDESDSDIDSEDEDDFEDSAADKPDRVWESFQTSCDPYSPLQGWKLNSHTPVGLVSLDENTTTDSGDCSVTASPDPAPRRKSTIETLRIPVTKPSLKRSSSTGCLWIPHGGQGPERPFLNKKVHFCEGSPLVIAFEVPTWSSEYCDSRKGPWQEMARDRCRFMDRIRSTEAQIAHVFTPNHRWKVQQRLHITSS